MTTGARLGETTVYNGDCLAVMDALALIGTQVDSIVTDPPYHLTTTKRFGGNGAPAQYGTDGLYQRASRGFMGKEWDGGDIAFDPETWRRCFALLKPGGYLLAFSGSRTYHRMACAIEDAGYWGEPDRNGKREWHPTPFEIRDQLMWLYGTGFPKSHDVSKAIDKAAGAERELVAPRSVIAHQRNIGNTRPYMEDPDHKTWSDEPATDAARQWEGWGTALKPAHEPIVMARKPLIGTVAANVLAHGTGAINIDACRVGTGESRRSMTGGMARKASPVYGAFANDTVEHIETTQGRFPANVIHDGSDEVLEAFAAYGESKGTARVGKRSGKDTGILGAFAGQDVVTMGYDDAGSPARFFYSAKASKADRAGSKHPTVKPVALISYLATLITPPGGVCLDPFAGSGTLAAAWPRCILIEREAEYYADILRRLDHAA